MPPEPTRSDLRLAALLHDTRRQAPGDVTQAAMAAALGLSQARISRVERGAYPLTRGQVRAWLTRADAAPERRAEVLDAFDDTAARSQSWDAAFDAEGARHLQDVEDRFTRASVLVLDLSTSVVPGLLQTPSYHRAMLGAYGDTTGGRQDVTAAVDARQGRQAVLLEDGRAFEFILTARALASADLGGDAAGREQRARIAAAARHGHIWAGVVPDDRIDAETGFVLYDRGEDGVSVRVELPHGPVTVYDPRSVEVYRDLFTRLRHAARPL